MKEHHIMSARGQVDFVGQRIFDSFEKLPANEAPNNLIVTAKTNQGKWIEETTTDIGCRRALFKSCYIRWALAINGLHVAAEKYENIKWQATNKFVVRSLRCQSAEPVPIAEWTGKTTQENCLNTVTMLVAYGIIDLFACFEDWVTSIFRSYYRHNPKDLLKDKQYRKLKRLWKQSQDDRTKVPEWEEKLEARLDQWQKKILYKGLNKVFLSFCNVSKLKRPESYKNSTPETWSETLALIAFLRNSLIHGRDTVNGDLEELCNRPHSMGFSFEAGEPLALNLTHLQRIEQFSDQLLTAINLSLCEHPDAGM